MWGSWWRKAAPGCALAALFGVLLSSDAGARRVRHVSVEDSGRVVADIRVSERGIRIDSRGNDSLIRGSRVRIGPAHIEVDDEGTGMVRLFSDVHVQPGQHVDGDVVAVFGSVRVDGEVSGDAVAVMGSVELGPAAVVDGDVVSVGGKVEHAEGAKVQGDTVGISFLPMLTWGLPALPVMLITLFGAWAFALFIGWLVTLLFPERFVRIATTASRRTGASFLLGLLSFPIVIVGFFLLLITVIGIPLALLLPFIYVLVVYVGQLGCTYVLGCKLMPRHRPEEGRDSMMALTLGASFVLLFFLVASILSMMTGPPRVLALFLAALGGLIVLGMNLIGTGAVLISRGGSPPRAEVAPLGAQPPPAAPASPPRPPEPAAPPIA